MSFTPSQDSVEDQAKKNQINNMFNIWLDVAGSGDKATLIQNQVSIKQDLYDKLNIEEISSLTAYSIALRDMLNSKSIPLSATFLNSLAYLTSNFITAKEIVGKTNAANLFNSFGLSNINV
jgi:hypothetical protein